MEILKRRRERKICSKTVWAHKLREGSLVMKTEKEELVVHTTLYNHVRTIACVRLLLGHTIAFSLVARLHSLYVIWF